MMKKAAFFPYSVREEEPEDKKLTYRTIPVRMNADGVPKTLDEKTRSVEVVGITENPVEVWDWERMEIVKEVLLMDGCELPASGQVVMFDTHMRFSGTSSVIGSYRGMQIENKELIGRAHFTTLPEGEEPWTKLREGHLTDFSGGYRVLESEWIPAGKTATIKGRKFEGPLKVSIRWVPKELSICPFGADESAKTRTPAQTHNPKTEVSDMNKKLKEKLIARGMDPNATDQEAWAYLAGLEDSDDLLRAAYETSARTQQTVVADPDAGTETPEEIARRTLKEERERAGEIRAMSQTYGTPDTLRDQLIDDGTSIHEAREAVWKDAEKRREESQQDMDNASLGTRFEVGIHERDKFSEAAQDAVLIRAGIGPETPAAGADDLSGYRLIELARMCLRMNNQPTGGHIMEMVGRAMQTADFQNILSNVANKSLFEGFDATEESWRVWCGTGRTPNFLQQTIARLGEFDDLDEIPEKGRYKYGEMPDAQEVYQMLTFGKIFPITRQAIINDDLGAFTDIPKAQGEAAARKVGDLPYAVLIANAAMGDGVALFHANHGNLGTAGVPSETTIGEGIKLMRLQKDIGDQRRLNIRAQYFVAPATLEGASEVFFGSNQFAGADTGATRNNPYAGTRFTRVYEARLDDSSVTAYYLMGPKGKTVKIFFLDGNERPYLETKSGWTVDGQEFKVRIDAVAKAVAWEAMVKNAGA